MKENLSYKQYIQGKFDILEFMFAEKQANIKRQEAQRNELNSQVRQVKEELQALKEPHSYVGDVVNKWERIKFQLKQIQKENML
ncbi:unnamed protein product [Paramecium sonneborni]|uniref:Uncharacterized protein n=1 Tax=Paramecium sonneborni TaxID=65129 RepID=A0A8S1JYJ2_9CILI|nr:unnamed protein product [Paramecium sonneborni]